MSKTEKPGHQEQELDMDKKRMERLKRDIEQKEEREKEKQEKIDARLKEKTDDLGGPNQKSYARNEEGDWVEVPTTEKKHVVTRGDQGTVKEAREFKKDEAPVAVSQSPSQSPDAGKESATKPLQSGKSKDGGCSIQ